MQDPNMDDFFSRLDRIERTHRSGGGFEAAGTLGMTYYNSLKHQKRRGSWIFPAAMVCLAVVAIKAGVLSNIGETAYADRIAALEAGGMADRVGAWVVQADPLTMKLSAVLADIAH